MKVSLHPQAELELVATAAFYAQKAGAVLGESFVAEFTRTVDLLVVHPRLGASWQGELRRLPLRRFPYTIVYREAESTIEIVAIAHQSRKPGYWRDRE